MHRAGQAGWELLPAGIRGGAAIFTERELVQPVLLQCEVVEPVILECGAII